MTVDLNALSLQEIMQLHSDLIAAMTRRFQRNLAVVFTDVVGSTPYFARFGDVAGRALQQRHFDLLGAAIRPHEGRVVDTAGDGAFVVFPGADEAALALIDLYEAIEASNRDQPAPHRLSIRAGMHFGPVITDGGPVSGDAVNLCARVAGSCDAGRIRATQDAVLSLSSKLRLRCTPLPPATLKGIAEPVVMSDLRWVEARAVPKRLQVLPSFESFDLPERDVVRIGRLGEATPGGPPANDIVLTMSPRVSRWHCELHRRGESWVVRSVTEAATTVDGKPVLRGEEAPIAIQSILRLGDAVTLQVVGDEQGPAGGATEYTPSAIRG